jgi:hypothetical protein
MSTGEVTWVLRAFAPPPLPVSAVLQAGRRLPMRVRVVVEFLARVFEEDTHLWSKGRRAPLRRR